ncbi:hypothetical protein F4818DRAFT_203337 [Hypoxylon cercidicola]|nr:hypothetical protein F4818DRAFT_203337 [Hypoxylon cercidicola]
MYFYVPKNVTGLRASLANILIPNTEVLVCKDCGFVRHRNHGHCHHCQSSSRHHSSSHHHHHHHSSSHHSSSPHHSSSHHHSRSTHRESGSYSKKDSRNKDSREKDNSKKDHSNRSYNSYSAPPSHRPLPNHGPSRPLNHSSSSIAPRRTSEEINRELEKIDERIDQLRKLRDG